MTIMDVLVAVFTAGLPLFLLSFALVSIALHRGWLVGESVKALQGGIEALGKSQKNKDSRRTFDPAVGQWFKFGGGFYGLVALYTLLLIELKDIASFLSGIGSLLLDFDPGALIGLVINLVIESFMNFVAAITWPVYWLSSSGNPLVLLLFAYAGYWLGIKAAWHARQQGWAIKAAGSLNRSVTPLKMNRWFRLREDGWLCLVLGLLMVFLGASVADGRWWYAGLAVLFMVPTVMIWYRQVTSRWCSRCDQPMRMERVTSGEQVSQQYRCARCDAVRRSGVQLEWPE